MFGTRFYDANSANWTQVDPLPSEPRYAFVSGDPINRADPTGTDGWDCLTGIGWDDIEECGTVRPC